MKRPRLVPEGPAVGLTARRVAPQAVEAVALSEPAGSWGRLPELTLIAALSLLLVAGGDAASWRGERWGAALFWCGLVLLLTLFAARLLSGSAARRERLGLVVMLAL